MSRPHKQPVPKRRVHYPVGVARKPTCIIPWCYRNDQKLYPLRFFGEILHVCWSHRDIYPDNSKALWRRLLEGYDPKAATDTRR